MSSYLLELSRWNVKNDGTDAVNTSKGINDALVWASQQGYSEVVLPNGTYLISENNPIKPQSFMTFNLGGATLRIRDNGLQRYAIVSYQSNQQYARLTNGKIEGDRNTHDYTTIPGTHEKGNGVEVGSFTPELGSNARFITIDNVEIFNCTGDGILFASTFGQILPTPAQMAASFEQGGINTANGTLTTDSKRIRSTLKINLNQPLIVKNGYFGLYGSGFGGLGSEITANHYDVIFYKNDNTFLSAVSTVQFFDEVDVPAGAGYAKIDIHQSNLPSGSGVTINVRAAEFPRHCYVDKCQIHHCRRQGITLGGGKHIYIRDSEIHHIAGTDPQAGIDIEDGFDLNQFIFIDGNDIHDNFGYDIIAVNGKYILINKNRISAVSKYVSLGLNRGVDKAIISGNIFHKAFVAIEGEAIFSNNQLYGSHLRLAGDTVLPREISVSGCKFNNCLLTLDKSTPYQIQVTDCKFYNDVQKTHSFYTDKWCTVTFRKEPQIFSNCEFDGNDHFYLFNIITGTQGGWIFDNITFKNISKPFVAPAGTYTNCKFLISAALSLNGSATNNAEYILQSCTLNTNATVNNMKTFRLMNCQLTLKEGTAIKVQNVSDEAILKGNVISYPNAAKAGSVIRIENTFTGNLIVMEDNTIFSSITQIGIENLAPVNQNVIVTVRNNLIRHATLKLNGSEIRSGNVIDGVVVP